MGGTQGEAVTRFAGLICLADWLAKVGAGSVSANETMDAAVGLAGPVLRYSAKEATARRLVPSEFEGMPATYAAGGISALCLLSGLGTDGCPIRITASGADPSAVHVRERSTGPGEDGVVAQLTKASRSMRAMKTLNQ